MNTETLNKMKLLHLHGMHRSFSLLLEQKKSEHFTPDELIAQLINQEYDERAHRAIERITRSARFRYKATIEQVEFIHSRGLDKNQLHRMADCTFINRKENMLITGSTGTGKSFIASAIGHQACILGYKVLYAHTSKLFAQLKMAKADGSILKEMNKIAKQDLLILDDFGLQPFDAQSRLILMELIEDRHQNRSTLLTSQLPVKQWHDAIGEQTVADAILDRLVHDAHRIELSGESLRKRKTETIFETATEIKSNLNR